MGGSVENDLSMSKFARRVKIAYIWIFTHPAKAKLTV